MRFGLQIDTYGAGPAGNEWDTMLAAARLAEEVGFESVWYEDHFMFRDAERPENPSPRIECLTALAALAATTRRVQLGALVLGVPYRNPALVAKILTSLDIISHGRLIIGLGAGWHEQEFAAYGWPFPSVAERMERLEDAVQLIDKMMTQRPTSYQGRHYSVTQALNDPLPVQRPRPPILVAGNGERQTLRIVARYADMCNVYGSVDECAHKFEVLRRHCHDAGRPYEAITRTINYWTLFGRDQAERDAKKVRFPDAGAVDSPEEIISQLEKYAAAGTQYAIVKILDGGDIEPVRVFAERVLPAFRVDQRPSKGS